MRTLFQGAQKAVCAGPLKGGPEVAPQSVRGPTLGTRYNTHATQCGQPPCSLWPAFTAAPGKHFFAGSFVFFPIFAKPIFAGVSQKPDISTLV